MAKQIFDLEKEITKSVYDTKEDEQKYADKLFEGLFDEVKKIRGSIPYPDVGPYAVVECLSDPRRKKKPYCKEESKSSLLEKT